MVDALLGFRVQGRPMATCTRLLIEIVHQDHVLLRPRRCLRRVISACKEPAQGISWPSHQDHCRRLRASLLQDSVAHGTPATPTSTSRHSPRQRRPLRLAPETSLCQPFRLVTTCRRLLDEMIQRQRLQLQSKIPPRCHCRFPTSLANYH